MAISPFGSERIAFEHPCVLVGALFMLRQRDRNCFDQRTSCRMRKRGLKMFAASLSLAIAACAQTPANPVQAPMIAGGWQAADPASGEVRQAANYALTQLPAGHGALAEVRSAQMQVVAGINYRMVLSLVDGTIWEATVWRKLDGSFELTGRSLKP